MSTGKSLSAALDAEMGANDDYIGIKYFLDTGIPELNHVLSGKYDGGVPVGRCIEIFGAASCGKTFLATMVMKSAQEMGGLAVFADHEYAFEPELARSLGLDVDNPDRFRYIRPTTLEQSLDSAAKIAEVVRDNELIPANAPIVFVLDSTAAAVPHQKLYNDKGERREVGSFKMNDHLALAKGLSQGLPTVVQWAGRYDMTVLFLNQIRMKPGVMYGDPTTTPGGNAMEFFASTRVSLGRQEITNGKKGADKDVLGFRITANTTKNKVARPFRKAHWEVRFNAGMGVMIDQIGTNLDFLVRKGLIEQKGAYLIWEGKSIHRGPLLKLLKDDPDGVAKLRALYPTGEEELEDVTDSTAAPAKAKSLDDVLKF